MSCLKKVCPEGLEVCCGECIRKELKACPGCCLITMEDCNKYVDDSKEWKRRKAERKTERRLFLWAVILLVIVCAILGFAIHQSYENVKNAEKKESELLVAAEQSASAYSTITTFSIADLEVLSNVAASNQ